MDTKRRMEVEKDWRGRDKRLIVELFFDFRAAIIEKRNNFLTSRISKHGKLQRAVRIRGRFHYLCQS